MGGGAFGFRLKSIASAVDGDNLCMVKQGVEDSAGGRDITEQFAPFFNRTIGGHHGGTVLVTAHDDLQEDLGY